MKTKLTKLRKRLGEDHIDLLAINTLDNITTFK